MLQQLPLELNEIVDVKVIINSAQLILEHTTTIRKAYEHLIARYEQLSIENVELKCRSAKASNDSNGSVNLGHKRRKTDESVINDSVASNDPLNDAIQDISSYVEEEIIESTPKPDVTKKNVSKYATFKSPMKRNQIKVEQIDESTDSKTDQMMLDAQSVEMKRSPGSPLRSVENQCTVGKENRQRNASTKWISNSMASPNRISKSGFISVKSPKKVSRLSLSKPYKQSLLDFAKKSTNATEVDTCAETYFDGTPLKPTTNVKNKILRQQCLEACVNSSKDSDDENVFSFKTTATSTKTSPPNVKLEPQTGQVKESKALPDNEQTINNNPTSSCGSSVVALSGGASEIIVIEESQALFEDCSETFCEQLELKLQAVESMAGGLKINDNENVVANHNKSCSKCEMFMTSNPHLTLEDKLSMIERCVKRYPQRPDTDSEFWNPRFLPTPASQKLETLIDDRRITRKKKS